MEDLSYLQAFEEDVAKSKAIWAKWYDKETPETFDYPDKPLKWWFNYWAEKQPQKPYLLMGDMQIPYGYVNDVARRLANAFIALGIKAGDRIAVMAPNVPQYVMAMHAVWKMGAIEVPANPLYTVPELKYQFNDCTAETVVVMAAFAPKAIALLQDPESSIKRVIAFQLPSGKVELPQMEGLYDFNELVGSHPNTEPDYEGGPDDPVRLQYTGGTTGVPKGCVLTNYMCFSMHLRCAVVSTLGYTAVKQEDYRTLAAVPLNHVYGFNFNVGVCLASGGSICLIPQPKPDALLAEIAKNRPNIFAAVPAMIIGLINDEGVKAGTVDISSLVGVFVGSAPTPVAVIEEFKRLAKTPIFIEGYGMSETSNILTANPAWHGKVGSVGFPMTDTEIVIVDAATGTKVMPHGESGEIICRGPQVMKEYWNKPEETAATIRNGWLHTGDIASMDDDGYIFILDRKKDIIIVNGFNVFPRDIDEVMHTNPKVKEACAFGIKHPTKGEAPVIFIVLNPGETMDAAEAEAFLRKSLAPYKIPVAYEFVEELPRTAVGKMDRKAMQAMYEKMHA